MKQDVVVEVPSTQRKRGAKPGAEYRWIHVSHLWAKQIRIKQQSVKMFVPATILRKKEVISNGF
jgi:hypothetical protein